MDLNEFLENDIVEVKVMFGEVFIAETYLFSSTIKRYVDRHGFCGYDDFGKVAVLNFSVVSRTVRKELFMAIERTWEEMYRKYE